MVILYRYCDFYVYYLNNNIYFVVIYVGYVSGDIVEKIYIYFLVIIVIYIIFMIY